MVSEFLQGGKENIPGPSDEARKRQEELELRAKELAHGIIDVLKADLKARSLNEAVANVPLIYQEYSTDCGIACGRMVLVYFGESDPGTDGWVTEAKKRNLNIPEVVGADGQPGPAESADSTQSLLDVYGIDQRMAFGSSEKQIQDFTSALIDGRLVRLGILYHDLHPEDENKMIRYHSFLAKGYRFNKSGELVIVANDPKPEIGGEIEINEETLSKALLYPFRTYSKAEAK